MKKKTVLKMLPLFMITVLFCLNIFSLDVFSKTYKHSYKKEMNFYATISEVSSVSIKGNTLVIKGKVYRNNELNRRKTFKGTNKFKLNKKTKFYYAKFSGYTKRYSKSKFKSNPLKKFRKRKKGYKYLYINYVKGRIVRVTITDDVNTYYWHFY